MSIAPPNISSNAMPGTTYFVKPAWLTSPGAEDSGWGFYLAVDVATGRTIAENDEIGLLVQHMTAAFPHLALVENMATANWRSCLRTVPEGERL